MDIFEFLCESDMDDYDDSWNSEESTHIMNPGPFAGDTEDVEGLSE